MDALDRRIVRCGIALAAATTLSGCASLQFSDQRRPDGVTFFDPKPVMIVACDEHDRQTVTFTAVPDVTHPRSVRAKSGWGSANLTATFSGGLLTQFGQQTDTKIPETITALTGVASLGLTGGAKGFPAAASADAKCVPGVFEFTAGGLARLAGTGAP